MLRLLEAGLHSPEHVLFINTMMEVSNSRFSAHIQHGGGGSESTGVEGCGWVLVYVLTWTWIRKATGHTGFQWFGPGVRFEL